jgi:hypothetical protein
MSKYVVGMQAEVAAANLHPLLERLAGESEPLLRRSVLTAIAALAQPGSAAGPFPEALWDPWSERVSSLWALAHPILLLASG